VSALSAGTELLVYRGQVPSEMALDLTISTLAGPAHYPLRYGYACVGRVIERGAGVGAEWQGRLVFAFQPHASHFISPLDELWVVPDAITSEQAVLLPHIETAINFVMDGAPLIGERVIVLGQGVVGLLTTILLAAKPLASLITLDRFALRRTTS